MIFCVAGIMGLLAVFQANQLTEVLRVVMLRPWGLDYGQSTRWIIGITMMILVAIVILGGIQRIAKVASRLVPFMVTMYFLGVFVILYKI